MTGEFQESTQRRSKTNIVHEDIIRVDSLEFSSLVYAHISVISSHLVLAPRDPSVFNVLVRVRWYIARATGVGGWSL